MSKNRRFQKYNPFYWLGRRLGKKKAEKADIFHEEMVMSPTRMAYNNFKANKMSVLAVFVFLFVFLSCMILPIFFPVDVRATESTMNNLPPALNYLSVPSSLQKNPRDLTEGPYFGAGITSEGKIEVWGNLSKGLKKLPESVKTKKFSKISAGKDHILALTEDGELVTWGNDEFGLDIIPFELASAKIKEIYAGFQFSAVLTEDGEMVIWGNEMNSNISAYLLNDAKIKELHFNAYSGIALTEDKHLLNMSTLDFPTASIPEDIQGHVEQLALTNTYACALLDDGRVVSWGNSFKEDYVPMPDNLDGNVKEIVAGERHFVALMKDGTLQAFGDNVFGQCDVPSGTYDHIEANFFATFAYREDGSVNYWGLKGFPFGTDELGRDVFRRLLVGGRMTMTVGAISVIIAAIIGIIVGGISGFYSGSVDVFLMRLTEVVSSIPFLPLAMILSGILGGRLTEIQRIMMIMVILGVLSWSGLARLVRAQILSERKQEFVTAAKALGVKESVIIFKHILPNVITVILVSLTLSFATCMLTESSLSFLGFGVMEPAPTWGNMLNGAQSSQVIEVYWWRWVFPSLALAFCTISINAFGDGLRDAIDPKSNER